MSRSFAAMRGDGVPIEEWANEFILRCLFNPDREKAKWKRGLIGRITAWIRPETGWANHDQGEPDVTIRGGPNPLAVQHKGMSCG